tara:strand:- start:1222 stop:1359 length:138 start_codon:yes stop_codon:yes gene_type:complete
LVFPLHLAPQDLVLAAEKWAGELDVNGDLDAIRDEIVRKIIELTR